MRTLSSLLTPALALPGIAARATEFVFRRGDAMGDIHPDDPARGDVTGPEPDRIAILGETGEVSLGVRTHELSLPAFLARHRSLRTGRGVSWSFTALSGSRLRDAPGAIAGCDDDLANVHAVVLLAGITDVLRVTSTATWDRQMAAALDALRACLPDDAWILVADIPPLDNAGSLSRAARVAAGIHGRALNRHTRAVVARYPRARAVPFPEELTRSLWVPESEEARYTQTYKVWGRHLAEALADVRG